MEDVVFALQVPKLHTETSPGHNQKCCSESIRGKLLMLTTSIKLCTSLAIDSALEINEIKKRNSRKKIVHIKMNKNKKPIDTAQLKEFYNIKHCRKI